MMERWKSLALVAAAAAVAAAFAFGIAHFTSNESELDDAYALMTRAMSRPGKVLHTVSMDLNVDSSCPSTTET